ncbi:hypothetical protein LZ198_00105 [Myxococcus sp. K15C18031901]|uniref:hypothetical protein n=1 Tax=Myxococcus dinghuensis TaxID=2906761 RepID=UPI0020A756F7|nr:hypothetical protein [Myxococcus dinghuensis]MCP3097267.1 hypothetical protein [Myxococcus dinghuensis]
MSPSASAFPRAPRPALLSLLFPLVSLGCGGEESRDTREAPLAAATQAASDANLYDSFSRANHDSRLNSLEQGVHAWTSNPYWGSAWGVMGGRAYLAKDDGTWMDHYTTVPGTSDVRVMVTLAVLGQYSGLTFRHVDRSNCWKLATDTSQGKYFLTRYLSGTQTFPLQINQVPVAGDVLEVRAQGTRIDVYLNGVFKGGVDDSTHQYATRVGLLGSQDNLARFDEFKVYTQGTRDATLQPFRSNSVWNLPIGQGATYADTTDLATKDFLATSLNGITLTSWANWNQYSHPVSFAADTDPWATVTDYNDSSRNGAYYVPATAVIADGSDKHMHVINPQKTYLDEAWATTRQSTTAYSVGRHHTIDLYGSGLGPRAGVRAYGGSAVGGLIRAWETTSTHPSYTGKIQHAIALAVDRAQLYYSGGWSGYDSSGYGTAKGYVWPATEQDWGSESTYKGHVSMGAYFAIPPSVDINAQGLTAEGKMVAQALQDFGAYITDATVGCVTFYVEPAAPSAFVNNLRKDAARLRSLLRRVTNNSPSTPNGPGTRRVPLLPDLAPPR